MKIIEIIKPADPGRPPHDPCHFTGKVVALEIVREKDHAGVHVLRVTFHKGARTHWHSHPLGQTLVVTDGHGWIQQRDGAVKHIKRGDVVWTPPNVEHWHGATRNDCMTHIAIQGIKSDERTNWLEEDPAEQYLK